MKLTISNVNVSGIEDRQMLKIIRDAGFNGVDFSLPQYANWNYVTKQKRNGLLHIPTEKVLDYFGNLKKYADSIGLEIGQMHSPFPCYMENDLDFSVYSIALAKTSIEICAVMGCRYIVTHPAFTDGFYDGVPEKIEKTFEINKSFYTELIPLLKKYNICIGIENMWASAPYTKKIIPAVCSHATELIKYVDTFNEMAGEKCFCACLDIGHCNLTGDDPAEFITQLGRRLEIIHLHDNDGLRDLHTCPYIGNIKWDTVCTALRTMEYRGNMNLETSSFFNSFPVELYPECLRLLAKTAEHLVSMI
ncbi:MAG: sugar phosphate isomerase/epimerase [Clostridiales bacterium]|jgi:sugar phosphate isomerase/epimerase|nr:sugar phosphate isomerase/epimerase [Clostridiales bacterium]